MGSIWRSKTCAVAGLFVSSCAIPGGDQHPSVQVFVENRCDHTVTFGVGFSEEEADDYAEEYPILIAPGGFGGGAVTVNDPEHQQTVVLKIFETDTKIRVVEFEVSDYLHVAPADAAACA